MSTAAFVIDRRARKRLKRHFKPTHWYAEYLMLAGFLLMLMWPFMSRFDPYVPLGALALGVGIIWRQLRLLFIASQAEFDRIAEADFSYAAQVALQTFSLEPRDLRDEPCKFRSTATKRAIGETFKGQKLGTDEKMRRSPHEFLVVHFGHNVLFVFGCVWDLTTGNTIEVWTSEFSYRDIASVELAHKKQTIRINLKTRELLPLWTRHGITKINGVLQVPTDESVSFRLTNGESVPIFAWTRSVGGIPSGEGFKSHANAVRLQKIVRELKHRPPPTTPGSRPGAAPPPTIRHMRSS